MRIRELRPEDHARVGELTLAAYDALEHKLPDDYRAVLADPGERVRNGATVLVAEDDDGTVSGTPGTLLGSLVAVLDDSEYFEHEYGVDGDAGFRMLAVDPAYAGRGVGATLVHDVIRRARERGLTRMVIITMAWMERAHALYGRFGFVREPRLDLRFESGQGLAFVLDLDDASRQVG